jgi:serine/threonine protein kinase
MGRVWRAADEMLDRQVAVKEMRIDGLDPEDTRTRRERTLREARATARIDHPNVVRIYDVVDEGERLWIVMELVAGRSLEQIVVEDGPLGPREAARIGLQLVSALRQVHAGGVLHRDIKPGNVLVERRGHRVVLTDFGIAALQDAEALTMVGMLVGSPDYMAPERISGRPQGPPSDVWSLGATLCAALGGRSPFSRSTTLATLHAVLYEEPELPASAGDLRDILAALLQKEPSTRPGLAEVEAELAEIVYRGSGAGVGTGSAELPDTGPEYDFDSAYEFEYATETGAEAEAEAESESRAGAGVGSWGGAESESEPGPWPEPEPDVPNATAPLLQPAREEPATPALLDAELLRAARQPPSDLPEATPPPEEERAPEGTPEPEPVHDAIPLHRTPTRKSPPDFEKHPKLQPQKQPQNHPKGPPEQPPASAPNASTEVPSAVRAEVGSEIPSAGTPDTSAQTATAMTAARLPAASGPVGMPPGELPGPAAPSGGPRRSRRRMGLAAASGVVAAGVVAWVVIASMSGSPDDRAGASSGSSAPTASSGAVGSASPSSTVEGTSRPPSLPPGAHREAGGYAWATPKGWRRDLKTGSEVHYTSPDGKQELAATSSLAKGDLMQTWQTSEQNARQGRDYQKIRLDRTTFQGRPAVVWEYTFTLKGVHWHALLLGFDADGKSYQVNTWYQPDIENQAVQVYQQVKNSFTVL